MPEDEEKGKEGPDPRMYMIVQHVFVSGLRLEQLMNRELSKDGITVKQFHLLWITGSMDHPPSINEAAEEMASSHQNVKQIALQLQRKGFLRMERDPEDRRYLRLHLTRKNTEYWKRRAPEHDRAMRRLFSNLSDRELTHLTEDLGKMKKHLEYLVEQGRSI